MAAHSSRYEIISCVNCGSGKEDHHPFNKTSVAHYGHMYGDPLSIVVCSICGLVFLNPQPTREALDAFYREEYYAKSPPIKDIDALISQKTWQRDFLYTWLIKQLPEEIINWDILDIGSGYGVWLQWFDKSNHMAGVESSTQASQVAKDVFGIEVYQTDFLANDLQGEAYDLVTGLAIIEHFNDPLEALVETNRLLKNGGYLFLQTPDIHGMVLRQGISRYFKVVHTYYYSLASMSSLLEKAGFEIIASRRRPPLVATSGILFPDNYWSGELDILAVKGVKRTLDEARNHPASSTERDKVVSSLKAASARDSAFIRYAKLYRMKVIRIPFKLIFGFMNLLRIPRSIFEVQAERLDLEIEN